MRKFKIYDLIIGILFTVLFISIAVIITINFRPLYYLDVRLLNIEANSGLAKAEILRNYNALIDYCSPFFGGDLVFPTLTASPSGLYHFVQVKQIFTFFYFLGAGTLIIGIITIIRKTKAKDYSYLFASAIMSIVLPAILGILIALNFDRTFILFHKIVFRNNDWLFDPATDPVITILPEAFFMHCAVMIICIVILLSILFLVVYFSKKKNTGIKYRKNNGLKF